MPTTPLVFMSYAQFDDDFEGGALRRFRDELSRTLRFVSGNDVSIFQEGVDIKLGEQVQERISQSLNEAMVLVPVLTPSFFTDPTCRDILTQFLERERQWGRNDLVLTVYYQRVPDLEHAQENTDPLLHALAQRRPLDWQPLRGKDFNDSQVKQELERLAERIIALVEELQRAQQSEPFPLVSTIQNTNTEQDDAHDDVSPEQIEPPPPPAPDPAEHRQAEVQHEPTPEAAPQPPPPAPDPAEHRQAEEHRQEAAPQPMTPAPDPAEHRQAEEHRQEAAPPRPPPSLHPRTWNEWLHWLQYRLPWLFGILFLVFGILAPVLGLYNDLRDLLWPQPTPTVQATPTIPIPTMESSGWNIVVAGIGVFDEEREEAVDHQHGSNLSAQIARKLDDYDDANLRLWDDPGVGFVTGTADEREERAEAIAKTLNANVVVYGVITETVSGIQATFTPEFYVNDTGSLSAFAYATEILGAEQFGKPVTYTLGVPDGDSTLNDAMDERLSALRYFVRGLRLFVADNYASARVEFCSAILQAEHIDNRCVTVNEPNAETDTSHTAVVHLYLGALEFREGNLDDAFRHAVTAQEIWPEYPRPLMTKGALFSSLANAQYAEVLAGTYSPPPQAVPLGENVSCVEIDTIPNLTIEDNLKLAQRCYEAALELVISDDASRISAADVEPKVLMSLGSIAFILADIGHAEWQTAREIYHEVIAIHAAAAQAEPPGPEAEDDEDKQPEPLERMAAHASARLGYIIVCEPDCSDPRPKTTEEYEQARSYYEQALELLQPNEACQANVERCLLRDRASIRQYQEQLARIRALLERRNSEQSGATSHEMLSATRLRMKP